jgi:hypothetical protein|tara:strand:+ start:149 stop:703 length:555 start_codon:yes stop_codon:yes gene_type:complete
MLFQNIEYYETDNFQYLLIHKNGSSSVRECIKHLNPTVTKKTNFEKVRWTVIREPYRRFISGLKYDLKIQGLELEEVGYNSLHNLKINNFSMNHGNINHSTSQVPYLINTNINWYVELKDLSIFLKMHFDKVEHVNVNKEKEEEKIDLDLDPEEVRKYLEVDYYVYNEILNSHHLWKWQNGKIF